MKKRESQKNIPIDWNLECGKFSKVTSENLEWGTDVGILKFTVSLQFMTKLGTFKTKNAKTSDMDSEECPKIAFKNYMAFL